RRHVLIALGFGSDFAAVVAVARYQSRAKERCQDIFLSVAEFLASSWTRHADANIELTILIHESVSPASAVGALDEIPAGSMRRVRLAADTLSETPGNASI